MESQAKHWLIQWLRRRNPGLEISESSKIYDDGLVDSFGILELLQDTEQHFSIYFQDHELRQKFFRTIDDFARMIDKKISKS
jgi:acyl carrier protein